MKNRRHFILFSCAAAARSCATAGTSVRCSSSFVRRSRYIRAPQQLVRAPQQVHPCAAAARSCAAAGTSVRRSSSFVRSRIVLLGHRSISSHITSIMITSITKLKAHGNVLLYNDQPVVTVSLKDALLGMLEWMNNNIIMCSKAFDCVQRLYMGKIGQRALLRVIILLCRPHAAHMVNNRVLTVHDRTATTVVFIFPRYNTR